MPEPDLQRLFDRLGDDAASDGPGAAAAVATARRRSRSRVAGGTAVLLAVAVGAGVLLQPGETRDGLQVADPPVATEAPSPSPTPAPSPVATTPAPDPSPSPPPAAELVPVVVFYAGDSTAGLRLYRETHLRPASVGVVRDAVAAMLDEAPYDDDHVDLWAPGTAVLGVSRQDDVVTVDLSAEAATPTGGSEAAEVALQQLVWTVTTAAPDVRAVRLLVDGAAPADFWGALAVVEPVDRAPEDTVLADIWLDVPPGPDPSYGVGETFGGEASVFEATVDWQWVQDGVVVAEGFASSSEGAPGRGTWGAVVAVPPGDYVLRAFQYSLEDGSELSLDDTPVRVTG